MTKAMATYLVAVHILVDTNGTNPRSDIVATLDAQFKEPTIPLPATGTIIDWAVAGKDVAGSMTPTIIPPDYTAGTTPFPNSPAAQPKGAARWR
ncbi:MAG: hypothetical protein KDK08_18515 [Rhizobiaceae bacterium]|nr:hypothetical protein [Rhizobiaceae bacterium]